MVRYTLLALLFLSGLWYVVLPIGQTKPGVNYYTNDTRNFVTGFYREEFQKLHCTAFKLVNPFCYIKPFKINHSTNLASAYIAPKQKSTYLEEYFYPLRGSLIVNGYEPYDKNGKPFNKFSNPLLSDGKQYFSQVIVRYYTSSPAGRVFIYLLIWLSIYFGVKLFNKIRNN